MNAENAARKGPEPEDGDRDKLEAVIDRWPELTPATRRAIYVLAQGTLPQSTQKEIIALTDPLPPTG